MISINRVKIVPTKFPDGTSQVWKLSEDLLATIYKEYICTVLWEFEREEEFIHLAQLKTLLNQYTPCAHLDMPYLPYARQDKIVSNGTTFALKTFACLLNSLNFSQVSVLDAHNNNRAHEIENLVDRSPREYIEKAYKETRSNMILFPDAGAVQRYQHLVTGLWTSASKIRDQSTGAIEFLKLDGNVKGKRILICDDLCDGGYTFILAAKTLLMGKAKEVNLYTTHGLYSKGPHVLIDAGIKRLFTYKGELVPTTHGCWDYKKETK